MPYVITCGDEGVQINEGTRLGLVGAGFNFEHASTIISTLKKQLGNDLRIAASGQNDWTKQQLELDNWEQTAASMQQRIDALADKEGLLYAGFLPFADPQELEHDIKGHMVRPKGIHIGNSICFTLDGGEQTYHLGQYLISAEWISEVDEKVAKAAIQAQVDFYNTLGNSDDALFFTVQTGGELGEKVAAKNKALLEKWGFEFKEEA